MKRDYLSYVKILIATIVWGCISLVTRPLTTELGFSTMQVTVLRLIFSAVIMALYLLIYNKNLFKIRLKELPIFIVAGINFFCLIFLYITSIKENNSSALAAMLLYTSPIWITILSRIFFKEKITLMKAVSLFGTVGGCALLLLTQEIHVTVLGLILGLLSGLCYGLYSIFGKVLTKNNTAETNTFYTILFSAVCAVFFLDTGNISVAFSGNAIKSIILMAVLVVVMTILPYTLYTSSLKKVQASVAGIICILEPIVAALVGIIFLHDSINVFGIIGILLVILSLLLIEFDKKQ